MIVCEYDRPHTGPCIPWQGTTQHREHIALARDRQEWDERIAAQVRALLLNYVDDRHNRGATAEPRWWAPAEPNRREDET